MRGVGGEIRWGFVGISPRTTAIQAAVRYTGSRGIMAVGHVSVTPAAGPGVRPVEPRALGSFVCGVDVVYVDVDGPERAEWVIGALKSGKVVLSEALRPPEIAEIMRRAGDAPGA